MRLTHLQSHRLEQNGRIKRTHRTDYNSNECSRQMYKTDSNECTNRTHKMDLQNRHTRRTTTLINTRDRRTKRTTTRRNVKKRTYKYGRRKKTAQNGLRLKINAHNRRDSTRTYIMNSARYRCKSEIFMTQIAKTFTRKILIQIACFKCACNKMLV